MAGTLVFVLLARVPFVDGSLVHGHGYHGVHSHTVTLADPCEHDPHSTTHHRHNEDRGDGNNDSAGGERTDSWFIIVNAAAVASGVHRSSSAVIAKLVHPCSKVRPRLMTPGGLTDFGSFSSATCPSVRALRPVLALDALLQSSHALLL